MPVQDWFVSLGYFAIGAGALTTGSVWLAKRIVSQLLERDLRSFEVELKHHSDTELARLNADLRVAAFERETQFSNLHERRAEFIADLYDKLQYFYRTIAPLTLAIRFAGQRSDEDTLKDAHKIFQEAVNLYSSRKIYFPPDLCVRIEEFFKLAHDAEQNLFFFSMKPEVVSPGQKRAEMHEKAWETINKAIPPVLEALASQFREMLGDKKLPVGEQE
jgi:hypothetical protein